jgi:tRNA U34 5-carboxymethylaminomethyl modifying GTPase MnmE/TrmE
MLAHLEAAIDFPEEDIAPDEGRATKSASPIPFCRKIRDLLATAEQGRILREGVRAVIYGPGQRWKSSLLNRLLGYDRAMVSEIPGTTRDTIEEVIKLRDIPIRLLDTAGMRDSRTNWSVKGWRRTEKSLETADLLSIFSIVTPQNPLPSTSVQAVELNFYFSIRAISRNIATGKTSMPYGFVASRKMAFEVWKKRFSRAFRKIICDQRIPSRSTSDTVIVSART